ncbi:hypothetical protein EVAR_100591_1, partial [Eumeta japonica]
MGWLSRRDDTLSQNMDVEHFRVPFYHCGERIRSFSFWACLPPASAQSAVVPFRRALVACRPPRDGPSVRSSLRVVGLCFSRERDIGPVL